MKCKTSSKRAPYKTSSAGHTRMNLHVEASDIIYITFMVITCVSLVNIACQTGRHVDAVTVFGNKNIEILERIVNDRQKSQQAQR